MYNITRTHVRDDASVHRISFGNGMVIFHIYMRRVK